MAAGHRGKHAMVVRSLSFSYTPNVADSEVLQGVGFKVPFGARVVLVGLNGAGKSTLLSKPLGNACESHDAKHIQTWMPIVVETLMCPIRHQHGTVSSLLVSSDSMHTLGQQQSQSQTQSCYSR